MKTAALLLASLIFASFSGAASAHGLGEADIRNLAEAYGYVEYQKTAFTEIAHSYPALAPDVLRFQRRFRDRFPGAEAAVREHFACLCMLWGIWSQGAREIERTDRKTDAGGEIPDGGPRGEAARSF